MSKNSKLKTRDARQVPELVEGLSHIPKSRVPMSRVKNHVV